MGFNLKEQRMQRACENQHGHYIVVGLSARLEQEQRETRQGMKQKEVMFSGLSPHPSLWGCVSGSPNDLVSSSALKDILVLQSL